MAVGSSVAESLKPERGSYRVVHSPSVMVRDRPKGKVVGTQLLGALVHTDMCSVGGVGGGWVRIKGGYAGGEGWMLVDGGAPLQVLHHHPAPLPCARAAPELERASRRDEDLRE